MLYFGEQAGRILVLTSSLHKCKVRVICDVSSKLVYLPLVKSGNHFHIGPFLAASARCKYAFAFGISQQCVGIEEGISDDLWQGICIALALQDADLHQVFILMMQ